MRAIVVGGGIGGLAVALALRQAGIEAQVFERAREIREVGAGLALWSGTVAVLRRLGVAADVLAAGAPLNASRLLTWRGDTLIQWSAHEIAALVGEPSVCIHRADLQMVLYRSLGEDAVAVGKRCLGFEQDANGVTARFADGHEEHGDVLIGADGLHSTVRAQLHGDSRPRYAGYTCWRGIAPIQAGELAGTLSEIWGRGARFGLGDIGRGRMLWFATQNTPEGGQDEAGQQKNRLFERYRDWPAPIAAAIEATPQAAIIRNDIYDRPPVERRGEGRVTLLGDAAHPTTPNLGMGAGEAIEDALVVATQLGKQPADGAAALRRYEAQRKDRTARITNLSRQFGSMAQWANPVACAFRDWATKMTPPAVTRQQIRWLLAYQPT